MLGRRGTDRAQMTSWFEVRAALGGGFTCQPTQGGALTEHGQKRKTAAGLGPSGSYVPRLAYQPGTGL